VLGFVSLFLFVFETFGFLDKMFDAMHLAFNKQVHVWVPSNLMHLHAWYCAVLHGTAQYCMVLACTDLRDSTHYALSVRVSVHLVLDNHGTADNRQHATDDVQPTTCDRRRATDDVQRNRRRAMGGTLFVAFSTLTASPMCTAER
jgi:hypothetical protein